MGHDSCWQTHHPLSLLTQSWTHLWILPLELLSLPLTLCITQILQLLSAYYVSNTLLHTLNKHYKVITTLGYNCGHRNTVLTVSLNCQVPGSVMHQAPSCMQGALSRLTGEITHPVISLSSSTIHLGKILAHQARNKYRVEILVIFDMEG